MLIINKLNSLDLKLKYKKGINKTKDGLSLVSIHSKFQGLMEALEGPWGLYPKH